MLVIVISANFWPKCQGHYGTHLTRATILNPKSRPLWHPSEPIRATMAPIWTHLNPSGPLWHPSEPICWTHQGYYGTHLNPSEPIRATMAPIWTSTTGPQGSCCRRSTSAWRASCPWRSGDNLRLRVQRFQIMVMVAKLKRMFEIDVRWRFCFPSWKLFFFFKIFSRWRLWLLDSRQIIYLGALLRFLHDPKATVGFVGCALFSNMFRIFKTEKVCAHSFYIHSNCFQDRSSLFLLVLNCQLTS